MLSIPCRRGNAVRMQLRTFASGQKTVAPAMVFIKGEEMSRYTMQVIMDRWVDPYLDTSKWVYYDLSCKSRDETNDKCLHDAVEAGKRIGSIFKEPTITPTPDQAKAMGLSKPFGSPNGAMRRGWNGITISRDTIHIPGIKLGFSDPVLCERHAVGGEYGAGWKPVGAGRVMTTFFPDDVAIAPTVVDSRVLKDAESCVVSYDNPLDNVGDLAHIFFRRCLEKNVIPYVVTKKTVFKWQEGFWVEMKRVFDAEYKTKFLEKGLLDKCGGDLMHIISDAATMQIIRWTGGGFGMACHNYDGDMLTDQVSQVHRSPGFISSSLVGKDDEGNYIKEFEASHGTVADMYHAHLRGEETSMNPLGMVVALLDAVNHAADLDPTNKDKVNKWTAACREAMYKAFREGDGTKDMAGPTGKSTEGFVDAVRKNLDELMAKPGPVVPWKETDAKQQQKPKRIARARTIDMAAMKDTFNKYDLDAGGTICFEEFAKMMINLNAAPKKTIKEKTTARM